MQPHDELPEFPAVAVTFAARTVQRWCGATALLLAVAGSVPSPVAADRMQVTETPSPGRWTLAEGDRPVLVYNHGTIQPPDGFLEKVAPGNLKYAKPRSDYIHPLYGLDGQELTHDWSLDHPHHRGIYWAWPEVMLGEEMGDLHALQRVFARPVGTPVTRTKEAFAEIEARSRWMWEDTIPIVEETARIRVWRLRLEDMEPVRRIDLEFHFRALTNNVTVARRETRLYGGLNCRFASNAGQELTTYIAPEGSDPRPAWASLTGDFANKGSQILGIFQHPANLDYPGDWVQYPELNWLQPTFPRAGTRFPLPTDKPLILRYRFSNYASHPHSTWDAEWNRYANGSSDADLP
ncbi:MAG: PmoA family protein [Verrucomicrobiales bacterium]|nr:PmoA family protein [Verrucomicrobiales bacterium]